MDRNGNTLPEVTSGTTTGQPAAGTAHSIPNSAAPYVVAAAIESAEATHDYAPAAEFFGRLLGGGH
jgi:hypothetical protein